MAQRRIVDVFLELRAGFHVLERVDHAAHAEVVGHATIDHMDERALVAVLQIDGFAVTQQLAADRARRRIEPGDFLQPRLHRSLAAAAVVGVCDG